MINIKGNLITYLLISKKVKILLFHVIEYDVAKY